MDNEIKIKFPTWCKKKEMETVNKLCLSDDIDSLFSCIILQKLFPQLKIDRFYDFESLYISEQTDINEPCIGIDVDLMQGKCWGNHVTLNTNNQSANLNRIMNINSSNYTQKFCGSTLLQIISYYKINIDSLSELQKALLLVIDSTYLGYWFKNGHYCKEYLKLLELNCLLKVLEEHSKQDFKELDDKYKLNKSKIWIENKQLHTNIQTDKLQEIFPDLSFLLPKINFKLFHEFDTGRGYLNNAAGVFSCAMCYRNNYSYSKY